MLNFHVKDKIMGKFYIQVIKGPLKGKNFKLKKKLKIGRNQGDIILKDSLVSESHAELIYSDKEIKILDKDSKNKFYVNGKKCSSAVLTEGMKFQIGHSTFVLRFVKSPEEKWSDFLSSIEDIKDMPLSLQVFHQPVTVQFGTGLQKGQKYTLYYGPRFFGRHCVDCPVLDKKAPEKSFALIPQDGQILFKTSDPDRVLLNKKSVETASLKNKDQIFIGDSVLNISLGV